MTRTHQRWRAHTNTRTRTRACACARMHAHTRCTHNDMYPPTQARGPRQRGCWTTMPTPRRAIRCSECSKRGSTRRARTTSTWAASSSMATSSSHRLSVAHIAWPKPIVSPETVVGERGDLASSFTATCCCRRSSAVRGRCKRPGRTCGTARTRILCRVLGRGAVNRVTVATVAAPGGAGGSLDSASDRGRDADRQKEREATGCVRQSLQRGVRALDSHAGGGDSIVSEGPVWSSGVSRATRPLQCRSSTVVLAVIRCT